jgi:hypothetical protein
MFGGVKAGDIVTVEQGGKTRPCVVIESPPLAPAQLDLSVFGSKPDPNPMTFSGFGDTCTPRSHRQVIAFTGLAGSGKSTAAAHLCDVHGFERVRFAGPLKSMMAALGLTETEIDGDRKEMPCALLGGKTPRLAMQTIGTEWGRDIIDPDLWIRAWQAAVDHLPAAVPVVVDDCRFPNEASAVRAAGGTLVRIVRVGAGAGAAGHSSEGQELPFDLEITNNGSPDDLQRRLDVAVRDLSWLGHTH